MSELVKSLLKGLAISGAGGIVAVLTPFVTPVTTDPKSIVISIVAANIVNFLKVKFIDKK